jgi:hypothetical protein
MGYPFSMLCSCRHCVPRSRPRHDPQSCRAGTDTTSIVFVSCFLVSCFVPPVVSRRLAHLDIYRKNNKQLFMVTMESFCKQERRPRATTTTRRGKELTHIPKTGQPTTPGPDSPNRTSRVTNTLPNDLRGLNLQQRVHQERTDITERLTNHSLRRKREDAQ